MACTSPHWLTDPVTAMYCFTWTSDSADSTAYSSVLEAESPSTPEYDCSNTSLAERLRGASTAYRALRNPLMISTPLVCDVPDSWAWRSMSIIPSRPTPTVAVMRDGLPKA